jgi:hypothetical protein
MIIKFDHISYIAERKEKSRLCKKLGTPYFIEEKKPNLNIKKDLMRCWQGDHDLFFYSENLPVEYIFYDNVVSRSTIEVKQKTVYGSYYNENAALQFLRGLFGEKVRISDGVIECNMKGILDKCDRMLVLRGGQKVDEAYLDDGGYGVATIMVNKKFSLIPEDGVCTDCEQIEINGKLMEVCFTKSASTNMIFEIIHPL